VPSSHPSSSHKPTTPSSSGGGGGDNSGTALNFGGFAIGNMNSAISVGIVAGGGCLLLMFTALIFWIRRRTTFCQPRKKKMSPYEEWVDFYDSKAQGEQPHFTKKIAEPAAFPESGIVDMTNSPMHYNKELPAERGLHTRATSSALASVSTPTSSPASVSVPAPPVLSTNATTATATSPRLSVYDPYAASASTETSTRGTSRRASEFGQYNEAFGALRRSTPQSTGASPILEEGEEEKEEVRFYIDILQAK